jgi:hypothetical protein
VRRVANAVGPCAWLSQNRDFRAGIRKPTEFHEIFAQFASERHIVQNLSSDNEKTINSMLPAAA